MQRTTLTDVVATTVSVYRAQHRLTQRELAGRLGWYAAKLCDLENSRRIVSVDDLLLLCRTLELTLHELLHGAALDDRTIFGLLQPTAHALSKEVSVTGVSRHLTISPRPGRT